METYNITVEHEVAKNLVARASYIGNLGRRLSYTDDFNYARYAPGATTGNIQQRRPYQDFASILATYSAATSSYHGLQLSAERRVANNFSFEVNYTWSKSIDEVSADTTPQNASQTIPMNRRLNRGVSDFDYTHRFVGSWVWALPAFREWNAVARGILGGWQSTGITTIRSGGPFSVFSGTDRALSGLGSSFADVVGDPSLPVGRSRAEKIAQYFNTAAFAQASMGTFGTSPRNSMRGPGAVSFDLGFMKIFPVTEKVRLQLRGELFNAFNTPRFSNPFATVNVPARFGRIESAADPRIVQLALKLAF
jgi:hypothetical protein